MPKVFTQIGIGAVKIMLSPLSTVNATLALPYLGYDPSTFELAGSTPRGLARQEPEALAAALIARVAEEKQRKELAVYYYRINHTMAFPLPLAARPDAMPAGIPEMKAYPWLTWLSWAVEERWRLLLAAWQMLGDVDAGELLQQELAALAGWSSFVEWNGDAGLALGHIAGVLALTLQNADALSPQYASAIRQAAMNLLERDVQPWFQRHWAAVEPPLEPKNLHNIPLIALTRSAQLARAVGHPMVDMLDAKAKILLAAWCEQRLHPTAPHTEGTAYDGYLMDSLTEWLDGLPDRDALLPVCKDALLSLVDHWIALALPGRVDLQAPLGDVEPEMPFWMSVLTRLAIWFDECVENGGWWLLQHLPPDRMPAATLVLLCANASRMAVAAPAPPVTSPQIVPNAAVIRSGWDSADFLVAMGSGGSRMSHLHQDGGHVVIGWQNRFWLTDPGYQQYRRGEERDYSMGPSAHNVPVIGGIAQSQRASQVIEVRGADVVGEGSHQYLQMDLTNCYSGLPADARVLRHLWFSSPEEDDVDAAIGDAAAMILVADQLLGFAEGTEVVTSWHLGTHLAWAFCDGWARLSDGAHNLWMRPLHTLLSPLQLTRHAGSRGPLAITHSDTLAQADSVQWWVFVCNPQLTWTPPVLENHNLSSMIRSVGIALPR